MTNKENIFEVLSAENQLNPAPLGDVDVQAAVNVELSNRLTSYWHDYLPEAVVLNGLAVAAAFEQQNRAKYQRLNRELIVREGISSKLKPIFKLALVLNNGSATVSSKLIAFKSLPSPSPSNA